MTNRILLKVRWKGLDLKSKQLIGAKAVLTTKRDLTQRKTEIGRKSEAHVSAIITRGLTKKAETERGQAKYI